MTQAATTDRHPFLAHFAASGRELAGSGPAWLRDLRARGMARFEELGFPTSKLEEWKNTNVDPIANTEFSPALSDAPALDASDLPEIARLDLGGPRLVFVDGRYAEGLSRVDDLPEGVEVARLEQMLERHGESLHPYLEPRELSGAGAFEALNAALAPDAAFVRLADGVRLEHPIHIVWLATCGSQAIASWPRTVLIAGRSSQADVVESWVGQGDGVAFADVVSDAFVGDGARLRHYRLQVQGPRAFQTSTLSCRQGRNSHYAAYAFDLGGRLVRHDLVGVLGEEGADCHLWGLYLTDGEQHLDHHTILDHATPHGDSREVYKGILDGRSRAVFNGRIIVREGAQKTDAKQSNPNLLLSRGALAHTRPQLEIYADDVKCTHGATVGQIDEESIFYLRTRGIPGHEARNILVRAFAGEILDRVEIDAVRSHLERAVEQRLARRSTT